MRRWGMLERGKLLLEEFVTSPGSAKKLWIRRYMFGV